MNIPWNKIAALVGPTIPGSAVIQHLAKLRVRMFPNTLQHIHLVVADTIIGMVQQGLSVPPPLRRGSGQRISTALSIPPSGRTANYPIPAHKGPSKPRQVRRKKMASENTDSEGYGSDSVDKDRKKRLSLRTTDRLVRENLIAQGFLGPETLAPECPGDEPIFRGAKRIRRDHPSTQ